MKDIRVIVKQGMVMDVTGIPINCRVTVIDYDVAGDDDSTDHDHNGKLCYISEWNHEV